MKRKAVIAGALLALVTTCGLGWYRAADAGYQRATDPIRMNHREYIQSLILEYAQKTGHLPFEEQAKEEPFMVLLGHSEREEDTFAQEEVLRKGGRWANGPLLEKELSKGLGRAVVLPRDPQLVATYAPNVYVYFVLRGSFAVAAHLFFPVERAVPYSWRGGTFYSLAPEYSRKPAATKKH